MEEALDGGLGVFEHHGFLDAGDKHAEGEGAHALDGDEVDREGRGGVEKREGGGEVEEAGGGLGVGLDEEGVVGLVAAEDVEENFGAP